MRLKAEGGARFGPNGEMHILGGAFVPDGIFNKEIRDACKKSDQLAIEAIVSASRVPSSDPPASSVCREVPPKETLRSVRRGSTRPEAADFKYQ